VKHFRSVPRIFENRVLCGAATFLFATSGILAAQAGQTYEQLVAAHPGWVQVPGQLIRPDCVHEIPNGASVEITTDGQATGDVTLKGEVIAHYDPCPEAPIRTRHVDTAAETPDSAKSAPVFNGWVEASQEDLSLRSTDNIDWESGEFYVPNNPRVNGGLIYIFNSIEAASHNWSLFPVLQYGHSPAGGGYYWAIASWIVSSGGYVFHSPLERVKQGDKLQGFTEQTGQSGSTSDWETKAYDLTTGAYSWITARTSDVHWTWAYAGVLEVYNVNSCSQLPSSGFARFLNNSVDHGFPKYYAVPPRFLGEVYQSGCNDSVYVNNRSDYTILYY
jgi:hypothetical protein